MCCKASSISNLTKHGAGTPSLSVILTEERIPFNVAHLSGSRRVSVGEVHRGGVELPCHGDKISPASRCRAAGNPANLSQYRLDLLTRAASDHRFTRWHPGPIGRTSGGPSESVVCGQREGSASGGPSPTWARGESACGDGEIQAAFQPCVRGAGATTK